MSKLSKVPFRSLSAAKEGYLKLRSSVRNMREETKRQVMGLARTGEGILAGGTMGMINGYFNEPAIGPVPVDVALGGVLKAAALVVGGEVSEHIGALGDGCLIGFAYRKAEKMGAEASADANDVDLATIRSRRARGENDDGTAAGSPGDHPGADAPVDD